MDQTNESGVDGWSAIGSPGRDYYRLNRNTVDMSRPGSGVEAIEIPALPQNVILDLNKTALIIIDMQNEFCSERGWLGRLGQDVSGAAKLIAPIGRVSESLRKKNIPVIWVNWGVRPDRLNLSPGTQHTFNSDGCSAGLGDLLGLSPGDNEKEAHRILEKDSWGARIVEDLRPSPDDIHVDKHRISGFWDTPLDSILRHLNIRTILFAGINADQCVYATLMDANFHGYDTLLIEDCTATTSPSFCLEATLYNVRFAFGFTLKSSDLLARLAP
jgi:ureidoacrylate peracid hydrolase